MSEPEPDPRTALKRKPWLRGSDYDPSHPWFYVRGYTPFALDEIEPANNVPVFGKRSRRVIEGEIIDAVRELEKASRHYEDLVARGEEALSDNDRTMDSPGPCRPIHSALALAFNHVSYFKGRLITLRRMLSEDPGPIGPDRNEGRPEIRKRRAIGKPLMLDFNG